MKTTPTRFQKFSGWPLALILGALVLVFAGVTAFRMLAPHGASPFGNPSLVKVQVIKTGTMPVLLNATGTIEAEEQVDINPEIQGVVEWIGFTEGQAVGKGQLLMKLKDARQSAQYQEAISAVGASSEAMAMEGAQMAQLQAMAQKAQAQEVLAKSEWDRYEALYQQQLISSLELQQKKTSYQAAQADAQAAQKQVHWAQARVNQAQLALKESSARKQFNRVQVDETEIRAPFGGIVGQKYVHVGDYVALTEKLLTLVNTQTLKVSFPVPESYLSQLKLGQQVLLNTDNLGARQQHQGQIHAHVIFIDPAVNLDNRTVTVKALIENPEGIRPGQFCDVALLLDALHDVVIIPEEALVPQGEKMFVYVSRPSKEASVGSAVAAASGGAASGKSSPKPQQVRQAVLQSIQVGHRASGRVEITQGLQPGERVVIDGLQKIQDGAPIIEMADSP